MPAETRRMTDAEFEASYGGGLTSWDESAQGNAYGNLYQEALAARAEARTLRGCLAALQEAAGIRAVRAFRATQEEWESGYVRASLPPQEAAQNPSEAYDAKAEAFYRETGLLAPGKDAPPGFGGSREERQEAWQRWLGELAEEVGEEAHRGA